MKKIKLLVLGLITITVLTSCAKPLDDIKESTETSKEVKKEALTIDFETIDISDIENDKMYQLISYPVATVNKDILKPEIEKMNENFKSVAEKFKADNKEEVRNFLKEYGDGEGDERYYMHEVYPNVLTNDDKYLSLLVRTEEDLLGAHGGYVIDGWNFDVNTGKKLSIYDMVKSKESLKQFILDWCKKNENNEEIGLYDEYKDTIDAYFNDEYELQFTIDNGVVAVVFQAYDIAPYAAGPIEIQLDKSILK